jgi:hypothetical protein
MQNISGTETLSGLTNAQISFGGANDMLTFIGSTTSAITANGENQTLALQGDSWLSVSNAAATPLTVEIQGTNSNITLADFAHNMTIQLDQQGAYTITDNHARGGAFINTAHSSIYVMGVTAATLANEVTAVA